MHPGTLVPWNKMQSGMVVRSKTKNITSFSYIIYGEPVHPETFVLLAMLSTVKKKLLPKVNFLIIGKETVRRLNLNFENLP